MVFELVVANAVGRSRRVTQGGREYIVAPLTSIVPGVLPGSKGPLLYEEEDISHNVSGWDNQPLTMFHPLSPNGDHISAKTPGAGVWKRQGIGRTKSSTYNGKLRHEGWFDVEKTRRADKTFGTDVLGSLDRNEPIEVSTGLFTDNEERSGSHNGRPYIAVARNHRPDHIAILPGQTGACSRNDGCGVLINQLSQAVENEGNFRSEQQRKYMWSQEPEIAESWAHGEHTSDKDHKMPEGPGEDVKGPQAAKARERREKLKSKKKVTGNSMSKCPECGGKMDKGECEDCGYESPAHNQLSDSQLGARLRRLLFNTEQPRHPTEGTFQGKADTHAQRGYTGTDVDRLRPKKGGTAEEDEERMGNDWTNRTAEVMEHEEDEQEGTAEDGPTHDAGNMGTGTRKPNRVDHGSNHGRQDSNIQNCSTTMERNSMDPQFSNPSDPHQASKQAASSTVMTEHEPAAEPAMDAMKSSKAGDHDEASDSHEEAAKIHEKAATGARKQGDHDSAMDHDSAAALHRKAASMHAAKAVMNQSTVTNQEGDPMDRKKALAVLTANCTCTDERAAFGKMTTNTLLRLAKLQLNAAKNVANAKVEGSNADGKGSGTLQVGGEEDEGEEGEGDGKGAKHDTPGDQETVTPHAKKDAPPALNHRVLSKQDREWLAEQPPRVQQLLTNAFNMEYQEADRLSKALIANVSNKDLRTRLYNFHMKKPLDQLRDEALALPMAPTSNGYQSRMQRISQAQQPLQPNYLGMGGGAEEVTVNAGNPNDPELVLDLPTMNALEEEENS